MKQIQWFPGHMSKTKSEIKEKLKLVDVIFEMLDARVPFSSRNPELSDLIGDKPRLIILNKSSLADKRKTKQWIEYFKNQGLMAIDIDSIDLTNVDKIVKTTREILKPLFEKNMKKGITRTAFRAMIVGIPNSGKSTLINSLSKRKATVTGDRPGVTKNTSWIKVSEELEIMDTPGILWPKFEVENQAYNLALSGAIKDDILPLDDIVIYGFKFLDKYYQSVFKERYKLNEYDIDNVLEIYNHIGKIRGCFQKAEIDYERVNKLFLQDIRSNIFGGVTFDIYEEFISL